MDLPAPEPVKVESISTGMDMSGGMMADGNPPMDTPDPTNVNGNGTHPGANQINGMFQMAPPAAEAQQDSGKKRTADSAQLKSTLDDDDDSKDLTEQQKLERRERNREHAKRSRLRKKFLLESLQEQIHGLEEQVSAFKKTIKEELPDKAATIITTICGDKDKFTPLPMPSGFGPVKTLMEPDFRLMSALSGSQQNFAISDPTLPDNPIVYVSQGFLDLTGYTLDQVLGRNCRFLQGPGTDQSAVEVIRKGITEGVDTSVCLLNYRADGTPFWNQFFVAALRDAENNVVNYVGVQCEVSKAVVEKHMGEKSHKAT
jgi:PAS domain S-box-containing protein